MDWPALPLILSRLALLLAGLLLPGALVLRALTLPRSLAGSFVLSAAVLYLTVLVLALAHGPITLLTLGLGPAAVCLGCLRSATRRGAVPPVAGSGPWFPYLTGLGGWLPLFLLLVAVLAYRLAYDPLSGPDVRFRWSYLAEQMLRYRTLEFYPALTAGDFLRSFWPESIPPGIASLYAWSYACGGSIAPAWTTPVVVLELLALFEFVWVLAGARGGGEAARWSVLLTAACPLLLWVFLLGQETGLQTAAVVGLVFYLDQITGRESRITPDGPLPEGDGGGPSRRLAAAGTPPPTPPNNPPSADRRPWVLPAAAAAIVATSTREYGFLFAIAGVAALLFSPVARPSALRLALWSWPVALLWPLHCWARTGNPFYSLDLGGLFPVNPLFLDWNRLFLMQHRSTLHVLPDWLSLGRYLILWALPACGGMGLLVSRRPAGWARPALLIGLSIGLWFISVPYTAGGLFYSLRVLGPALALLVVIAGIGLGQWLPRPTPRWFVLLLLCLSLEALPKTLVLPGNPYHLPITGWFQASREPGREWHFGEEEMLAKLAALPAGPGIVSDNFDLPRLAARVDRRVAPLWSPEFAWFFDRGCSPGEAARRWQASGIRYLVVGRTGPTLGFLHESGRWTTPGYTLQLTGATPTHFFLEFVPAKGGHNPGG